MKYISILVRVGLLLFACSSMLFSCSPSSQAREEVEEIKGQETAPTEQTDTEEVEESKRQETAPTEQADTEEVEESKGQETAPTEQTDTKERTDSLSQDWDMVFQETQDTFEALKP